MLVSGRLEKKMYKLKYFIKWKRVKVMFSPNKEPLLEVLLTKPHLNQRCRIAVQGSGISICGGQRPRFGR